MPGKYYEELDEGMVIKHALGRTLTEADNVFFSTMTMNPQALHLNADFASKTEFGKPLVNGLLTMSLIVGISVGEITDGTIVANLGYENVVHPHPVFHGDTIYVETEILEKRESKSKPDLGIIKMRHRGRNQHGDIVCEVVRTAMFLKRPAES